MTKLCECCKEKEKIFSFRLCSSCFVKWTRYISKIIEKARTQRGHIDSETEFKKWIKKEQDKKENKKEKVNFT